MTYQCPHCAAPITHDAAFCPNCGGRLTMATTSAAAGLAPSPPVVAPQRNVSRALLVGGLLLALVVGGALVYSRIQVDQIMGNVASAIGATPTPPVGSVSPTCKAEIKPLYDALQEINGRLNVGLTYAAYSERVGDASVAYENLDTTKLDSVCVALVGTPVETALNAYIRAYNTWNDCVGNTSCDNDSIQPSLQKEWATATEVLERVRGMVR